MTKMASKKAPASNKKAKRDQLVMATNNSSIVSKRSVERLYYPEPHFFRHFVKKPQRRAPLINRGYWLRMHAIDVVVRQFLEESSSRRKLILNLGCGYDPLAFQWLSKVRGTSQCATFVDIDFPDLISKKSQIISSTPQIRQLLGDIRFLGESDEITLYSDSYCAVGCDLADTGHLDTLLGNLIGVSQCQILCIAEVSITYMDVNAADSLIAWAARQSDARFCLLEQYLPDGATHPFASKMLQHFLNLQTPLKNIATYPDLKDQDRRFCSAGWSSVHARSLWDLFNDPLFVSYDERIALDHIEPFDEWEELNLFASHYFLLVAKQLPDNTFKHSLSMERPRPIVTSSTDGERNFYSPNPSNPCPEKKFGVILRKGFHDRDIYHVGGFGSRARTKAVNLYRADGHLGNEVTEISKNAETSDIGVISLPNDCEPRMCCTASPLGSPEFLWLLVGGRKSPHQPLKDCWLLREQRWKRVDDLPAPLYRHCSASLTVSPEPDVAKSAVLVFGGKTLKNELSNEWFLWQDSSGWETITANSLLEPVFGSTMVSCGHSRGILLGGMTKDGTIRHAAYVWHLKCVNSIGWCLHLTQCFVPADRSDMQALNYLFRFGATIERTSNGFLLIGGVANKIIPSQYEVVEILLENDDIRASGQLTLSVKPLIAELPTPRMLLVGHSSLYFSGRVVIIGGGAVCFSFGTHWNTAPITLYSESSLSDHGMIAFICSSNEMEVSTPQPDGLRLSSSSANRKEIVEEPSLLSERIFRNVTTHGQPVVSRKVELGRCIADWQSLEIVKDRVAREKEVVVHVSGHRHMDFRQKNFDYIKKTFGRFLDDFRLGHKQYLRSLASHDPVEKPADFTRDFPQLAKDFTFFDQLNLLTDRIHSSVLRISGFVDMWLHYDVMANLLCQIRGPKRLMLFPPSDVSHLSLPAGSSTSSIDCFNADFAEDPALTQTHPHHVILHPGDVLYIPPLWLHAASPIDSPSDDRTPNDGVNISINIFFRNLESGYAPGRDIYGNRDVQAYEKGRQDLEKITRAFDKLPLDMRRFYLDRLADELKEKAGSPQHKMS